ncbi:YceI family protein [Candidatus Acetothermia bacterium]|nr:YceI family protein [Candidatus Acetothermia bacterium]
MDIASLESHDTKRDEHLRSLDFFDVEKYPTLTFKSKRIEPVGRDRFKIIGDLTIKNVTREIVLDATSVGRIQDPWGNRRWGFSAQAVLNRKDFGLTWNLALEAGGWAVGDEVKVAIELEAIRKQS